MSLQELADLKSFHDPFSDATFIPRDDGGWLADFERRGSRVSLHRDSEGRIFSATTGEVVAGNFKSLLASKDFSNIRYLASSLLHEYEPASKDVMEVPFSIDGAAGINSSFLDVDVFLSSLSGGAVVGLEGPAGAGKTHFIERLAASRAESLLRGLGPAPLVIPVASAGKILSAIDDRIDGSLSALGRTSIGQSFRLLCGMD